MKKVMMMDGEKVMMDEAIGAGLDRDEIDDIVSSGGGQRSMEVMS